MTGWNMPPGVTGNEDYFGPRREYAADRECGTCPWSGKADVEEWNGGRTTWLCPACGAEHEDEPDEPDWDAIADARRDDELDRADDFWRDR